MQENEKGFSGLSKQTTNVEKLIEVEVSEKNLDQISSENFSQNPEPQQIEQNLKSRNGVNIDRDRKIPWGWIIGISIVAIVIYISSMDNNKSKSQNSMSSNTRTSPAEVLIEQIPPTGTDLVLNEAQITYCLSQEIRITGAESIVTRSNQNQIDRYNALIDDYNSRCSKFRYKTSDMQRAKEHVEIKRQSLILEGMLRMK